MITKNAVSSLNRLIFRAFQAAYTFDAGANACVYLLEREVAKFLSYLNTFFPNTETATDEYIRGIPIKLGPVIESVCRIRSIFY